MPRSASGGTVLANLWRRPGGVVRPAGRSYSELPLSKCLSLRGLTTISSTARPR